MKRIVAMYFSEKTADRVGTGLFLELEDGTWLAHASTDPVVSFNPIDVSKMPKIDGAEVEAEE